MRKIGLQLVKDVPGIGSVDISLPLTHLPIKLRVVRQEVRYAT